MLWLVTQVGRERCKEYPSPHPYENNSILELFRGGWEASSGLWETPRRAAGQLSCSSSQPLHPLFGKCMDLFQIKHPGMWNVGVPHPVGYSRCAGCLIARTKFAGHRPADSTWARTTLPKHVWAALAGEAGTPKGLIIPQNKCKGTAGEKYHRQDFWHRAVRTRAERTGGDGKLHHSYTS